MTVELTTEELLGEATLKSIEEAAAYAENRRRQAGIKEPGWYWYNTVPSGDHYTFKGGGQGYAYFDGDRWYARIWRTGDRLDGSPNRGLVVQGQWDPSDRDLKSLSSASAPDWHKHPKTAAWAYLEGLGEAPPLGES